MFLLMDQIDLFYQMFAVFISWRLRRPHWGNADGAEGIFGSCRTRVGCGPASGPTLKKALCRTCRVVGRRTNKDLFKKDLNLIRPCAKRKILKKKLHKKGKDEHTRNVIPKFMNDSIRFDMPLKSINSLEL